MLPIIQDIAKQLKDRQWQLVTAESCTGGLISATLTEIAGSSAWFERGFVTYSNLAKQQMLGVPEELITAHGAVSEPVALAMATGALKHSAGQISVSVTGIAGPDGGSVEKPVGTVCFAWAANGMTPRSIKMHIPGSRQEIRLNACQKALEGVLHVLKEIP
jgi:nicotinamide-nucleotide amidase